MTLAGARGRKKRDAAPGPRTPRVRPDAAALLAWYDRHRRRLPWRAAPGDAPDPYRVWLSEIMLQQTTVKAVGPFYERFAAQWPDVEALAAAPLDAVLKAWAGLGYYARARNLHACARAVADRHGGRFPADEAALRALPGIGAYTAAAVAAIAFGKRAAAVDGNVERVVTRLFAVTQALPAAKPAIRALAEDIVPAARCGDFAQAVMDLGATICTPKKPACELCPWKGACLARARGDAESFPRKAAKPERPLRRGAAFWIVRAEREVLVRQRSARGLLGGMTEVPTTAWSADFDTDSALADAPSFGDAKAQPRWRRLPGLVAHTFTHFPLELTVYACGVAAGTPAPPATRWVALEALGEEAFPSLMRKVAAHARSPETTPGPLAGQFTFARRKA